MFLTFLTLSFIIFVIKIVFVDLVVVENIIIKERGNAKKVYKLKSYTTAAGGKVREKITDYFKELM